MNFNKSLKIKRKGGSMTPAKSAIRIPTGGSPLRKGSPLRRRRRRTGPINPPKPHGRPTPGPRKPKSPSWYKGVKRDPRRDPIRRKGRFRNQQTNRFKKRRIRNRFTRTRTR